MRSLATVLTLTALFHAGPAWAQSPEAAFLEEHHPAIDVADPDVRTALDVLGGGQNLCPPDTLANMILCVEAIRDAVTE